MNKKEEFIVKEQAYLTVQPAGMLYTQGREYFLLHPNSKQATVTKIGKMSMSGDL